MTITIQKTIFSFQIRLKAVTVDLFQFFRETSSIPRRRSRQRRPWWGECTTYKPPGNTVSSSSYAYTTQHPGKVHLVSPSLSLSLSISPCRALYTHTHAEDNPLLSSLDSQRLCTVCFGICHSAWLPSSSPATTRLFASCLQIPYPFPTIPPRYLEAAPVSGENSQGVGRISAARRRDKGKRREIREEKWWKEKRWMDERRGENGEKVEVSLPAE